MQRGDPQYLTAIRERLYTAVLSDVLDDLGCRQQAMPPAIRPLDDALVMAGFARTGLYREVYRVTPDENPYELEMALIDIIGKVRGLPAYDVLGGRVRDARTLNERWPQSRALPRRWFCDDRPPGTQDPCAPLQ